MVALVLITLLSLIGASLSTSVDKGTNAGEVIEFNYKWCLLEHSIDQSKQDNLKEIRHAMREWDGHFINDAKDVNGNYVGLRSINRRLTFTEAQDHCQKGPSDDSDHVDRWGYSLHKDIDLIITFIKSGTPDSPFINENYDKAVMRIRRFPRDKTEWQSPFEILFNERHRFTADKIEYYMVHELGHFLGLRHNNNEESVMDPDSHAKRVSRIDRDNLIKEFTGKTRKFLKVGSELQIMVESRPKFEDLNFLHNLHITVVPQYMYTTPHHVHFILGTNTWSYPWSDVPLLGTPHRQHLHEVMPSELADMITGNHHIKGAHQRQADVVFELVLHKQHFTFVIQHNRVKMFDGHTVTDLQLSNKEELTAEEDNIKSVLLFPHSKEVALFSDHHYWLLDTGKWHSRPTARRILHLKKRHYSQENDIMRRVKLVYYLYPGDYSIFQAYDEHSYLGTYQITLNKVFTSTTLSLQPLDKVHQVQLPELMHSDGYHS